MGNPETLAALGSQDSGGRQTKQNKPQKTKTVNNMDPTKNLWWAPGTCEGQKIFGEPQAPVKGKWFLPLIRHLPCYLYIYKCIYSQYVFDTTIHKQTHINVKKWNIAVTMAIVICTNF